MPPRCRILPRVRVGCGLIGIPEEGSSPRPRDGRPIDFRVLHKNRPTLGIKAGDNGAYPSFPCAPFSSDLFLSRACPLRSVRAAPRPDRTRRWPCPPRGLIQRYSECGLPRARARSGSRPARSPLGPSSTASLAALKIGQSLHFMVQLQTNSMPVLRGCQRYCLLETLSVRLSTARLRVRDCGRDQGRNRRVCSPSLSPRPRSHR